jgi:hypothetical protein
VILKSLLVGALTALVGMIGTGVVASLAADWYNVSSFEGGAGFFVVGLAFVGLIGGFIIGLVTPAVMAKRARTRLVDCLGASTGAVAAILGIVGGVSWMLADIPPRIDDEELFLLAEIRWPPSGATEPSRLPGAYLRLGAMSGTSVRRIESGPVFTEDARQEDGLWIVPGVVPIFTSRGRRLLDFGANDVSMAAFVMPLPGRPSERHHEWSGWLSPTVSGQPDPNRFSYRYKVVKHSEPVRTQRFGRFEIDTIADYFHNVSGTDELAARGTFRIRYDGRPIPEIVSADAAAQVGSTVFVTVNEPRTTTPCALLIPDGDGVRVHWLKGCGTPLTARPITGDLRRFETARSRVPLPGWVDRTMFADPGLFQLDAAILDTRSLTSATFLFPEDTRPNTAVPPLDLSPDEHSFVWLADELEEKPQLGVTNWRSNRSYTLPIDRTRMRFNAESSFTPAWVRHHFAWQRGADGEDVLVERRDFVPLPHRGDLTLGKPGGYQSYTLRPGNDQLRDAVVDVLSHDLGGELMQEELSGFRRVRVRGKAVTVTAVGSPSYVSVTMDMDGSDPEVMSAIGAAVDAALASGRYDALFVKR